MEEEKDQDRKKAISLKLGEIMRKSIEKVNSQMAEGEEPIEVPEVWKEK